MDKQIAVTTRNRQHSCCVAQMHHAGYTDFIGRDKLFGWMTLILVMRYGNKEHSDKHNRQGDGLCRDNEERRGRFENRDSRGRILPQARGACDNTQIAINVLPGGVASAVQRTAGKQIGRVLDCYRRKRQGIRNVMLVGVLLIKCKN